MAKLADFTVTGKSGEKYKFEVYPKDSSWNEVAAVYLVTKRTIKPDGVGSHAHIYVGPTDNLKERFASHHKENCFTTREANCGCVLQVSSEQARLAIEADILAGDNWPCNV
jgi:hypothetical protein